MQPGVMAWAMLNGLPVGRAEPGGQPFAYGLDGKPFEHDLGPAAFPAVAELFGGQAMKRKPLTSRAKNRKPSNPYAE